MTSTLFFAASKSLRSWGVCGGAVGQVLSWSMELSRALCFLHNCNPVIIHRDLKPANLLLNEDGHLKVSCDHFVIHIPHLMRPCAPISWPVLSCLSALLVF